MKRYYVGFEAYVEVNAENEDEARRIAEEFLAEAPEEIREVQIATVEEE